MNKKEIKNVLKKMNYTLINSSWYTGENKDSVIFNAFNELGDCYTFYIDSQIQYATLQHLSNILIHERRDCSKWFF